MSRSNGKTSERTAKFLYGLGPLYSSQFRGEPVVMASPPTVAWSAANAASAITGARNFDSVASAVFDTRYFYATGGNPVRAGAGYPNDGAVISNSLNVENGSQAIGYNVLHDGTEIEFRTLNGGSCRVWVNDELVQIAMITGGANDGNFYRVKVTFGSRAIRRIRFEWADRFCGVTVGANDTLLAAPHIGPRVIVIGDSFTEGTGATNGLIMGYVNRLGYHLNADVWSSGSGGTGYLATNGARGTMRSRVTTDVTAWMPDICIIAAGINDGANSVAALQAEAALLYDKILTESPDTFLIAVSPFWKDESPVQILKDFGAVIKTEVESRGGLYLDFIGSIANSPCFWTGTGKVGATTGVGNSDLYVDNDGTHPTQAGHDAIAAYMVELIRAKLR